MPFRVPLLATLLLTAVPVLGDDVLHPGTPQFDRPTLMALGIRLPITGDDNHNARVTVRYRRAGASAWKQALPLYRVRPETRSSPVRRFPKPRHISCHKIYRPHRLCSDRIGFGRPQRQRGSI